MIPRLVALLCLVWFVPGAVAQTAPGLGAIERTRTVPIASSAAMPDRLRVGVVSRPPFAMAGPDGAFVGVGVDLWRLIAEAEGYAYDLTPIEGDPLDALAAGTVDLVLPATPTAEGEARADFSHAFYTATLGAAGVARVNAWDAAKAFLTWRFARIVLGLSLILLLVGAVMWLIERRANPEQFGTTDDDTEDEPGFGRRALRGLGSGFWWSGVTMTTIGYGDKAPVTVAGRAVAMLWMLVALGLTSALTASIVAATDLSRAGAIAIPGGLTDKRLGVIEGDVAAAYLDGEGLTYRAYADAEAGLRDAAAERIDAFIGPVPLLRHVMETLDADLNVSPSGAEPALMTIAYPQGSNLAEPIDAALLALTSGSGWVSLTERYIPSE